MGCCTGSLRNVNLKNEVFVKPEKFGKKQEIDIISPLINFQNIQKIEKEDFKKKKSKNKYENEKTSQDNISPQTYNDIEENIIKVQKKKVIKRGSQRVQQALKELKLLSLKELDNNKNFFHKK